MLGFVYLKPFLTALALFSLNFMSLIFIYQATFKCPLASCDCHFFAHHVKGALVRFLFSVFINAPLVFNKVIYSI